MKPLSRTYLYASLGLLALDAAWHGGAAVPAAPLVARIHDSGFPLGHDTYNGMCAASDGRIYYALSTASVDVGARMFAYDPRTGAVSCLGDLTDACGEAGANSIPQGKSHVNFVESDGRLYLATHLGYYCVVDGMERAGLPPPGYKPYPGGHLLAYDMAAGTFEKLGSAPGGEGILTMNMDTRRRRLYGITWPTGHFLRYDLDRRELRNLGTFAGEGESGRGPAYRVLCRSLAIDPDDGSAYFSTADGAIVRYQYAADSAVVIQGEDLRKDYFGCYDPAAPGHMAYNWRQTFWYPPERSIYAVHGNSGYLFRYDVAANRIELLDRITSEPSRRSGMYDQFSYGYLGFALGPDGRTIHYLTGGPGPADATRTGSKPAAATGSPGAAENFHLITYDIPERAYRDHGPILLENGDRPAGVNSIAVGSDGTVYTLSRIDRGGTTVTDLISIPGPFGRGGS